MSLTFCRLFDFGRKHIVTQKRTGPVSTVNVKFILKLCSYNSEEFDVEIYFC